MLLLEIILKMLQDATKESPPVSPFIKCKWPPAQVRQRLGGFLCETKAAVVSLNVLIQIYFPSTLGPEGSSQLMRTKLLSI